LNQQIIGHNNYAPIGLVQPINIALPGQPPIFVQSQPGFYPPVASNQYHQQMMISPNSGAPVWSTPSNPYFNAQNQHILMQQQAQHHQQMMIMQQHQQQQNSGSSWDPVMSTNMSSSSSSAFSTNLAAQNSNTTNK
jgi:hypothetical protein